MHGWMNVQYFPLIQKILLMYKIKRNVFLITIYDTNWNKNVFICALNHLCKPWDFSMLCSLWGVEWIKNPQLLELCKSFTLVRSCYNTFVNRQNTYAQTCFTSVDTGTPLGCANQVLTGVEPNEHGTWLYGRNGWCDGRNVFPWVIDITQQVSLNKHNQITYFGWFNGTDPNPKQNPGMISIYSYLVYYRS